MEVPLGAQAATISVTTAGDSGAAADCTLRQAIVSMNAGAVTGTNCAASGSFGTSDTINFDTAAFPNGGANTITLTGGQISITAYQLAIDATANGNVTIDANQASRVMYDNARNFGSLALNHLTLRNGRATAKDCLGYAIGGGICIPNANLTLTDSTLSGNYAAYAGGGILSVGGNITLTRSTLSSNTAKQNGGAIQSGLGTVTLTNSTLSGNSAMSGGGIMSSRTVTLSGSTLSNNTATQSGGGVYCAGLTVTNSTLSGNSAANGKGGGIYLRGGASGVSLMNSTLSGNSAANDKGGGIFIYTGNVMLTNSTLSGNSATIGGGIYESLHAYGPSQLQNRLTLVNSTLSGNSATNGSGGGISAYRSGTATNYLTLINATISANSATTHGGGVYSNVYNTLNNSIVAGNTQGGGGNDFYPGLGFQSGSNYMITGDPMLATLADNGGPTQTMLPLTGSPAFGTGNNANCPATDQRGVRRPQAANCDIGAVEVVLDRIFADNFDGTPIP